MVKALEGCTGKVRTLQGTGKAALSRGPSQPSGSGCPGDESGRKRRVKAKKRHFQASFVDFQRTFPASSDSCLSTDG